MLLTGCHIKAALLTFNYTCVFLIIYKELSEVCFLFIQLQQDTWLISHLTAVHLQLHELHLA